MHKQLKTTIDNVCQSEGLNHSELPILIGKSRQYIGRIYRLGCSDKVAEQTMDSIAALLEKDLNVIGELQVGIELLPEVTEIIEKTKLEIEAVKAENEMLRKQDSYRVQVLDKRNDLLENAKFENEQLENTVKHLQTVLNERTSELGKSERYHDDLLNKQGVLEKQLGESQKAHKHIDEVRKQSVEIGEKLLDENKELNKSVEYWSDGYAKKSKINAFMGWCILALLIVIGVVWFK